MRYNLNVSGREYKLIRASLVNFQRSLSLSDESNFDELIENIIDKILKKNLIDISKETSIKITISNIKNVEYYRTSRSVMESLVGVKNVEIEKFEVDNITYKVNIYGDFDSVQKQISVINSFVILESSFNERYLHLAYKQ